MNIPDNIEDIWGGAFGGLYGEVVTNDCYRLKELKFVPDLVIDIGANVGVFMRYARELWPQSEIMGLEPNRDNAAILAKFTKFDERMSFYGGMALGTEMMWHNKGARNGSGESYVSSGLGFDHNSMRQATSTEEADVTGGMLDLWINIFYKEDMKTVIKIDCEGGENVIWEHKPSMDLLKKMNYICMEIHLYALTGGKMYDDMREATLAGMKSLEQTHDCIYEHPHFWATKK